MSGKRPFAAFAVAIAIAGSAHGQAVIFNNGSLSTGGVTRSGVAAPAGTTWSETPDGNTVAGFAMTPNAAAPPAFRIQDDFTIATTQTLQTVTTFGYSTGAAETAAFTVGNMQIWNGRPGDVGSTVVFGDTTTNAIASSAFTNIYRIFSTATTLGGTITAPGTTRSIKSIVFNTPVVLGPGTYWIDWQATAITGFATAFAPPTSNADGVTRGPAGANGRQQTNATTFVDLLDTGNPAALPDVLQEMPFLVTAAPVPEPTSMALVGLAAAGMGWRRWRKK